jgi:hypothetical protein
MRQIEYKSLNMRDSHARVDRPQVNAHYMKLNRNALTFVYVHKLRVTTFMNCSKY